MLIQQIINGISLGGVYSLIATGYALIYSLLGFSNWAHGDVAMVGAYIGFISFATARMPFWMAAIVAILGAGLLSVINERLAYRRIRKNHSPTMFLMIAAMGVSVTLQNLVMVVVGPKFKTYPQVIPVQSLDFAGAHVGVLDVFSLVTAFVVIAILSLLINKTKFGLAVKAAASNMKVASLLGVNVDRYVALVFMLAGSLAGVAGVLLGMHYTVYPQMGNIALKAFIASVFGGLGSIPGAIVGAVGIGLLEVMVTGYVNSGLRDLITFSLLVAILLVRPQGLFGKFVEEKA